MTTNMLDEMDLCVVTLREALLRYCRVYNDRPAGLIVDKGIYHHAVECVEALKKEFRLHDKFQVLELSWLPLGTWILSGECGVFVLEAT